jgi:hypothetical protein
MPAIKAAKAASHRAPEARRSFTKVKMIPQPKSCCC